MKISFPDSKVYNLTRNYKTYLEKLSEMEYI